MDRTYTLNNIEIGENAIYYKCLVTGYKHKSAPDIIASVRYA
jgi:hypothetical protein